MIKEVKSCTYYSAIDGKEWKITEEKENALLSLDGEKKTVALNALWSLDILMEPYEAEAWAELPGKETADVAGEADAVTVAYGEETYRISRDRELPEKEKMLFADLKRYLAAYWEGTAQTGSVSVHSFDGGGPTWQLHMECKGVFTWFSRRHYYRADHEQLCGAGYDVTYELCPLRPGKGTALLTGDSPICPEPMRRICVEVDEQLKLSYHMEEVKDLDGNWEVQGVIGTRIEIEDPCITVLWRNEPVLQTYFRKEFRNGGIRLILEDRGMRYQRADSDYAELTELFYHDGKLEMTKVFPITGESAETLEQTENSRYGNYDIVDEILAELEGTWEDENGYLRLIFDGDTLDINDCVTEVHVLRSKGDSAPKNHYRIVDQDPAVYELQALSSLEYVNGELVGRDRILDAPSAVIRFHKKA